MPNRFQSLRCIYSTALIGLLASTAVSARPNEQDIDLYSLSLEDLANIVVTTAGKKPERIADIPASVVVVSREEIARKGYTSLEDILRHIPGFYAIDTWAYLGTAFGVRGYWTAEARNIKYLINGTDMVENWNNQYSLRHIAPPIETIDRLEIVRGPMSVVYGHGAFFGVVNIITNAYSSGESGTHVSLRYGSDNLKQATVRLQVNGLTDTDQPFSVSINAEQSQEDGRDESVNDMVSDLSSLEGLLSPDERTTDGKLSSNHTYLDATVSLGHWQIDYVNKRIEDGMYFSLPSSDETINYAIKSALSLTYKGNTSDNFHYKIKIGNQIDSSEAFTRWLDPTIWTYDIAKAEARYIEIDSFYSYSDKLDITFGAAHHDTKKYYQLWDYPALGTIFNNNERDFLSNETRVVQSFYSQFKYSPTKKIRLVLGARLERESRYKLKLRSLADGVLADDTDVSIAENADNDWATIPRIALLYHLNKNNTIKFLYGEAINRPGLFQRLNTQIFLKNEEISTSEVSYISQSSEDFSWTANLFYNELNRLTTRVFDSLDPNNYTSFTTSAGKLSTQGVELGIITTPVEQWRIESNLSFQQTTDGRSSYKNINPGYSPELLAYLTINYQQSDQLSFTLNGYYVDDMEARWDGPPDPALGGGRVGDGSDSYSVWSLATSYLQHLHSGQELQLRLVVSNLLDTDYRYPTTDINPWADKGLPGEGRRYDITASVQY